MTVEGSPTNLDLGAKEYLDSGTTFLGKDDALIHLHDKNPMVITLRYDD